MPKVEDSKPEGEFSKVGIGVSILLLALLCGLCWYWGFQIGATSLADPDTCWLLAVGRWIATHGALPPVDPFSWTAAAPDIHSLHYLPYQWLSTLVFFGVYKYCSAVGLLYFVSAVVLLAFLVLPLLLSRRLGNSLAAQGVRSVLAFSAASFHFPLRPELFSYLFISLLVHYLVTTITAPVTLPASSQSTDAKDRPSLIAHFLLGLVFFMLWANLHSAFVLGLIVLSLMVLFAFQKRLLACLLGALVGTLLTPFNFALYGYLPQLFFSPVNKFNQELLPLRLSELFFSSDYLPYAILQVIFVISLLALTRAVYIRKDKDKEKARVISDAAESVRPGAMFCAALVAALLFASGDLCRRMIPFAVLFSFLHFHLAWYYTFTQGEKPLWLRPLERVLKVDKFQLAALAAVILSIYYGTAASAMIFPSGIPQSTSGFQVPLKAIEYIRRHRPAGRVCNDAQYGDVLILALDERAQVFIDTRFDMYGPKLCLDYYKMANGLDDYRKLMDEYKIDWVFFPRRAPLLRRLQEDSSWKTIYSDEDALIMSRSGGSQ